MKRYQRSSWLSSLDFKKIFLVLIVLVIIITLFQNRGKVTVQVVFFQFLISKSLLILISICLGAVLFAFYPLILQMIKGQPNRRP